MNMFLPQNDRLGISPYAGFEPLSLASPWEIGGRFTALQNPLHKLLIEEFGFQDNPRPDTPGARGGVRKGGIEISSLDLGYGLRIDIAIVSADVEAALKMDQFSLDGEHLSIHSCKGRLYLANRHPLYLTEADHLEAVIPLLKFIVEQAEQVIERVEAKIIPK